MIRSVKEFANRLSALPEWMQELLLDDLNATIENRLSIFEKIARKGKQ